MPENLTDWSRWPSCELRKNGFVVWPCTPRLWKCPVSRLRFGSKLKGLQPIGSFKLRGAFNKVAAIVCP